ncbi:hypothetical protein PROPHIGD02-2_55 [Mycobacterium phage prophiGD02-2]|nr:hypothetical protein PROPHIGD02-2_55 [Mycobacterium phage prophiGD02-2]QST87325.1 hypothetical protein PROPHIGD90-1_55 [Mycobacterium phage prophiGD90-1]
MTMHGLHEVKDPDGYPGETFYQAYCTKCGDSCGYDSFGDFGAAVDEAINLGWFEVLTPMPSGGKEITDLLCPSCQFCELCGKPGSIGEVDDHLVCDDHYDYFG